MASREIALDYDQLVSGQTIYTYVGGNPISRRDPLGLFANGINDGANTRGHSDFYGNDIFDFNAQDRDRDPFDPRYTWEHFRDLGPVEADLRRALDQCDFRRFQYLMHQGQDHFSHYKTGFRWWTAGHIFAFPGTTDGNRDAWNAADNWGGSWVDAWKERVRQAWRVTSSVKVRWPGFAEPKARRRARASPRGGV